MICLLVASTLNVEVLAAKETKKDPKKDVKTAVAAKSTEKKSELLAAESQSGLHDGNLLLFRARTSVLSVSFFALLLS